MRFTLQIRMTNSEGVLERILGRLRQRNFNISSLTADCSADQSTIESTITLSSEHKVETAVKQLNKIYDVQYIRILPTEETYCFNTTNYIGEQNDARLPV